MDKVKKKKSGKKKSSSLKGVFKKVNVYYNKDTPKGGSKYLTGKFFSKKNNSEIVYRSAYELKFFYELEEDIEVHSYVSEGLHIPYIDSKGKRKIYIPDLLIIKTDGSMLVAEVKPKEMLRDIDVQLKAAACRKYMKKNCPDQVVDYKFVTEQHLFKDVNEYTKFVKENRDKIHTIPASHRF